MVSWADYLLGVATGTLIAGLLIGLAGAISDKITSSIINQCDEHGVVALHYTMYDCHRHAPAQ